MAGVTAQGQHPRLRFQLPLDAARLLRARERVRDYLRTLCPDDELVDDVVLCVEEACTNAIRHSGSREPMDVSLGFTDGVLEAQVRDRGQGFDVSRFDPRSMPDLMADGGRGLFLIASIMDQLDLAVDAGLVVRMVKRDIEEACPYLAVESAVPHGSVADPRQHRARALLEDIDEAFFAIDWEYRCVHANEAAGGFAHRPAAELLGHTALDVWPELAGTDVEQGLHDAMELGRPSTLEWRTPRGRWLEMRIYPTSTGVSVYVRDIALRKEAELAGQELLGDLRRSEERFRAMFEQAAVGMAHITPDGRYERVNRRFCELVGHTRAELERLTTRDVTHEDDIDLQQRYIDALLAGQRASYTFEKRYARADGGVVWASLTMSLVVDDTGAPDYIVVVAQDVSLQKRAAEMLRRYQLLSERARDVMLFVREKDGRIIEANQAAEAMYGYTREQLLERTVSDLRAEQHPWPVQGLMRSAMQRGGLFATQHRRADGSILPVEVSSHGAVSMDGDLVLLNVVRDVSERQAMADELKAERDALATVMASAPAHMAYLDDALRFVLVDDEFAADVGKSPAELLGTSALDVADPLAVELLEQVRRDDGPVEAIGQPLERPGHPERRVTYWDRRVSPVKDEAGRVKGYVLSRIDVTERVRGGLYAQGLSEVLERLGESRDPRRLMRILAEGVRGTLGADHWSIWEHDGSDTWKVMQADDALRLLRGRAVNAADAPFAMEAWETRQVVTVEDAQSDPRGRSLVARDVDGRSAIVVPLAVDEGPFMALFFSWAGRPRAFTSMETDFVTRAASAAVAAIDSARLYRALAERERLSAALNRVSASITSLLDRDEILSRVAREVGEALGADSSVVSMLETSGWVPRHGHGVPPGLLGVPIPPGSVPFADIGVRTQAVVAVDDCETDERVDRDFQRSWNMRAVMMAPLVVRRAVIGAVFFNYHAEPHRFSQAEIQFASSVAAVVSSALETARLYENERRVAVTLQEEFIHALPAIPGMELAATAEPAFHPELIGGDFFDAFEVGDGRVVVLVGDVEGKGVEAAGLTETVRSAVRSLALVDPAPGFILTKVNELLRRGGGRQFVTAVLFVVHPASGEAVYASAGHPPALVLSHGSCRELSTTTGIPLGTFRWTYQDQQTRLRLGDAVVLYTDGLTEMRRDGELFGEERALREARRFARAPLADLVDGLRQAAIDFGGEVRDDMQILAFRLLGGSASQTGESTTSRARDDRVAR